MNSRNILIFHLGALGDFILTWPLALTLARMHPQSRIIYVAHGQKGLLAEKVLGVESTDIENGWHHLFGNADALPQRAVKMLAGSHAIYSFIANPGDAWTSAVQKAAPNAALIHLRARPPAAYTRHATAYLLEQLTDRAAIAEGCRQMLQRIEGNGIRPRATAPGGPIVIHPGSGADGKCWPVERFLELARRLSQVGRQVRFVIGEAELDRWPEKTLALLAAVAPVERPRTYLELLSLLDAAAAYVGNDSGPTHLAGIIGIPTTAIFGPTDPAVWRPLGPRVKTVCGQRMEEINVDQVLGELQ